MTTNILTAVVTAYCVGGRYCPAHQPCADGHWPVQGVTVALPRRFPLGSTVIINGHAYKGEDRIAKKFGDRFDIFMQSEREALHWGKQTVRVTVITP